MSYATASCHKMIKSFSRVTLTQPHGLQTASLPNAPILPTFSPCTPAYLRLPQSPARIKLAFLELRRLKLQAAWRAMLVSEGVILHRLRAALHPMCTFSLPGMPAVLLENKDAMHRCSAVCWPADHVDTELKPHMLFLRLGGGACRPCCDADHLVDGLCACYACTITISRCLNSSPLARLLPGCSCDSMWATAWQSVPCARTRCIPGR